MQSKSDGMTLPGDLVFEILKWCQYKSIMSIRRVRIYLTSSLMQGRVRAKISRRNKVSKECRDMTMIRLIWVLLVRDFTDPDNQKRIRHVLERPFTTYATSELEALAKLWHKAESVWRDPNSQSPLQPSVQFKLNSPYFGFYSDMSTSFLVPGGKFFVEFGVDVSALYYDLDSCAPEPLVLIAPVTGRFVQDLTIFRPCVISSAENLSFNIGACFLDGQNDRWTTTLWRVSVVSSSATTLPSYQLEAEQIASFFFEHPPHATLYMEAMDLSGDIIALYSSVNPQPGQSESLCRAVTVVKWPEVINETVDFERRVLHVDDNFTTVNILPQNYILVHSMTRTLFLRYYDSPVYTRTPTASEISSRVAWRTLEDFRPDEDQQFMLEDNESIVSSPFSTNCHRNASTHTVVHQTILLGLKTDECIPCPLEIEFHDGALPTEEPRITVFEKIPASIGFGMDSLKFFTPPPGHRTGLLEFDEEGMKFSFYMIRDDDISLMKYGSIQLQAHRRGKGGMLIHAIDEGTGRILMYDYKASLVSVFDLIDCN